MKVKRELLNIIRVRQWSFMGHLLRKNDGMEHHIIETEMVGKRLSGQQRIRMFDWVTMRLHVHNAKDLGNIARDRGKANHDLSMAGDAMAQEEEDTLIESNL